MEPDIFSIFLSEDASLHDVEKLSVDIPPGIRSLCRSLFRYLIAILISTLAVLAVVLLVILFGNQILQIGNHHKPRLSCGNSSAEAIANGCHFDTGLVSWVPEACYFKEPGFEVSDYKWYLDQQQTVPVSPEDIRWGNFTHVYSNGSLHDQQCIYAWRKLSIALDKRLPLLDSKTASNWHLTQCANGISTIITESAQGVSTYSKYYSSMNVLYTECVPLF